jgi:hypothetical protein
MQQFLTSHKSNLHYILGVELLIQLVKANSSLSKPISFIFEHNSSLRPVWVVVKKLCCIIIA